MSPISLLTTAVVVAPLTDRGALSTVLRGVTGIYALYSQATGQYYIGSSVSIYNRILKYTQPAYQMRHSGFPIIRAIKEHGSSSFLVLICKSDLMSVRSDEQSAEDLYAPSFFLDLLALRSINLKKRVDNQRKAIKRRPQLDASSMSTAFYLSPLR